MGQCEYRHDPPERDGRRCPRVALDGWNRCAFHLTPEERGEAGIAGDDLRAVFLRDVRSEDDRYKILCGARFDVIDLSSLVVDGEDLGRIVFRDVSVTGRFDLSEAVVTHPITFDDCEIGSFDASDTTFEAGVTMRATSIGGENTSGTCLAARRTTFEEGFDLTDVHLGGSVEFAACTIEGWLDVEDVTVEGLFHLPRGSLEMTQFIDVTFGDTAEFGDATVEHLSFQRTRVADGLDLSGATLGTLRCHLIGDGEVVLREAALSGGRLEQPDDAVVLYDLTEATIGDVTLGCATDTFDRYRFYRTRFDGFPFAAYRDLLRANDWQIHRYRGTAETDVEDLEITYLEAKQGAMGVGDNENAGAFFVREMQFRRIRYWSHFRDPAYSLEHRIGGAVRWFTNAVLGLLAGYGERPQRTLVAAMVVILGSALAYPAAGGLDVGHGIVSYGSHGPAAIVDALYFSVVTFTTLGLGDVEPAGETGRVLVGMEALAGAFLTALFVFALGRRVTR